MTLTVSEIEGWSAGDVREVFHAATSRAQAAQDAADGIATLPALTTWGGTAAEAAKVSLHRTQLDLTAHSEQAMAVAAAARKAADNIEAIQQALKSLESDADDVGLQVNRVTNKMERKPHSTHGFRWQQQNIPPLQQRLDGIIAMANLVDRDLAHAIEMADGTTTAPGNPSVPPPPAALSPDVAALQRANDEAVLNAAARVTAAQEAVDKAAAEMYTHGPGTPEFDAAAAKLPGLKSELAAALAEAGAIPDFTSTDPNSVGVGLQGVNFSYRLPDGRLAQVTSSKLKDGSVELWDNGASAVYTYKDGKLVGTRFLDDGRAIATAEPLFTAVTAPVGVGPLLKGGQAAYLGLRGLFAKEGIEALAGSSGDDILARGSEIVATRAESATDNLAASTLDDLAAPATHSPVFDISTEHAQHLGFDHAQGRFIAREAETGLRIEQDLGVQLTRAQRGDSFDYLDPISGRSYDAVGNFPSQFFDKQWPRLQEQITLHLNKADIVPVDVSRFTPSQQQVVQDFVKGLGNPRIIVIGAQ